MLIEMSTFNEMFVSITTKVLYINNNFAQKFYHSLYFNLLITLIKALYSRLKLKIKLQIPAQRINFNVILYIN